MTESVQIAAITGIATVVSVVVAAWVQTKKIQAVHQAVSKQVEVLEQQDKRSLVLDGKVDEVRHEVNSKASAAAAKIESLETTISTLTTLLSKRGLNGPQTSEPKK